MVADCPPTRENRSLTCGFFNIRVAPGMPGATQSCPAGTGKHRPTTAGCAEYVPKFGEMLRVPRYGHWTSLTADVGKPACQIMSTRALLTLTWDAHLGAFSRRRQRLAARPGPWPAVAEGDGAAVVPRASNRRSGAPSLAEIPADKKSRWGSSGPQLRQVIVVIPCGSAAPGLG